MAGCSRLFAPVGPITFLNSRCWFIKSFQCISMKVKKIMEETSLPQKPKRPLTPFFKYLKLMRPHVINEFPKLKTTEIVKVLSERWAKEGHDHKLKLHQEYDAEYKEYMQKVIEYEKSLTPEQRVSIMVMQESINEAREKARRKHSFRQLGKPKKPPSAFLLYLQEHLKDKSSNTSMQELVKNVSLQWKDLNEEDKKQYSTQATELMKQYVKDKAEWQQKMLEEGYLNIVSHKDFSKLQNNENKRKK